jgi:hypothetical protein
MNKNSCSYFLNLFFLCVRKQSDKCNVSHTVTWLVKVHLQQTGVTTLYCNMKCRFRQDHSQPKLHSEGSWLVTPRSYNFPVPHDKRWIRSLLNLCTHQLYSVIFLKNTDIKCVNTVSIFSFLTMDYFVVSCPSVTPHNLWTDRFSLNWCKY